MWSAPAEPQLSDERCRVYLGLLKVLPIRVECVRLRHSQVVFKFQLRALLPQAPFA